MSRHLTPNSRCSQETPILGKSRAADSVSTSVSAVSAAVSALGQRRLLGWSLALLLGSPTVGCAPLFPNVLEPADIGDLREGTPSISRVRDMGAVHIGKPGPLLAESDGVTHIGELLLIEGSGFGKQPTVGIAGRPAEVRWRTRGGGIVVQVPAGCAVGPQRLWVTAGGSRAEAPITLHRLAVVLDPREGTGALHALRVGSGAAPVPAGPPLAVGTAKQKPISLALSPDGSAAYVLLAPPSQPADATGAVQVIDLVAPGGPKLVDTRKLRQRTHLLSTAEGTGLMALVGDEDLTLWDVSEGRRPAGYLPSPLPKNAQKPWAAALHPRGNLLALALADSNDVVLVDVTLRPDRTGTRPRDLASVNALPEARMPLLHRLRFSSDGETLWLSSGDNAASLAFGHQPTRLSALVLSPGEGGAESGPDRGLSVLKTVELRTPAGATGAPIDLAIARRPPIASGTTIRLPPDKAAVFVSTLNGPLSATAGKTDTSAAASASNPARAIPAAAGDGKIRGALLRGDLNGPARTVPTPADPEIIAGLDLSPGAELLVSARLQPSSGQLRLSVTDLLASASADGPVGEASLTLPAAGAEPTPGSAGAAIKSAGATDVWQMSQIPVLLQP